jgi:hypothetical protein
MSSAKGWDCGGIALSGKCFKLGCQLGCLDLCNYSFAPCCSTPLEALCTRQENAEVGRYTSACTVLYTRWYTVPATALQRCTAVQTLCMSLPCWSYLGSLLVMPVQLFLEAPLLSVPALPLLHILVVCAVLLHPWMQTAIIHSCRNRKACSSLGIKAQYQVIGCYGISPSCTH